MLKMHTLIDISFGRLSHTTLKMIEKFFCLCKREFMRVGFGRRSDLNGVELGYVEA